MVRRRKPPELILVLDYGGSATKGVYADSSLQEKLLVMEPEVISLPKSAIANYEKTKMGKAQPVDAAWVSVENDSCYVVGYLAQSRFNGNPGLSSLKYERAFPKTLAAVWVAAQELKLGNKFNAAIAVLLPAGEYENGADLEELLTDGLKDFQTPTGKMSVNLTHFECKPEGGGVYMVHRSQLGEAAGRKTVAVVMVGYRNASILLSERGQVNKRVTSTLGFIKLVDLVENRIAGLPSTAQLTRAIARAGEKIEARHLLPLAMSSVPEARSKEAQKIADAVAACRVEYASVLCSWLREVLPRKVSLDEAILCGGTAEYMRPELESHFAHAQISWHGCVELPEQLQDPELGSRLCDAYGMYIYFRSKVAAALAITEATA
ncbi:MAG TPA: ParM/StbA family protein [Leptolyngbyaceae cyanobacterium]